MVTNTMRNFLNADIQAILADYANYHIISRLLSAEYRIIIAYMGYDIMDYDRILTYNNKMIIYRGVNSYRFCYMSNGIIMEYVYINKNIYNTYIDINHAITYYMQNSIFLEYGNIIMHITCEDNEIKLQIVLEYDTNNVYMDSHNMTDEFHEIFRQIDARYQYYCRLQNSAASIAT